VQGQRIQDGNAQEVGVALVRGAFDDVTEDRVSGVAVPAAGAGGELDRPAGDGGDQPRRCDGPVVGQHVDASVVVGDA
jgi:hypothetical protein